MPEEALKILSRQPRPYTGKFASTEGAGCGFVDFGLAESLRMFYNLSLVEVIPV
jgi:hypothetical protein